MSRPSSSQTANTPSTTTQEDPAGTSHTTLSSQPVQQNFGPFYSFDQRRFTFQVANQQQQGILTDEPHSSAINSGASSLPDQEAQALHELRDLMTANRGQEVDFDHLPRTSRPSASTVPVLHPEMFEKKDFFQSCHDPTNSIPWGQKVKFDDLLSPNNPNRFFCLAGPPGVGKTTLSKRLAYNQEYELSLHLNFASINYTGQLTLQELLLNKQFLNFGFSAEKCQIVFSWIIKNQSKCLLVIDGLDQAQFKLDQHPPNETYNARLNVSTIIACLFKKIFLPNTRIIVTSRSHALLDLNYHQRPDTVYQLKGLSIEDTDTLLRFLSGNRYREFSSNMKKLDPELESLCTCPLLLQMFVLSQLTPSGSTSQSQTMTRIFATVLENLQRTTHFRTESSDLNEINVKVACLAYNTFKNNQIMITWEQVKTAGLQKEEIQDLIITVPGREGIACRVFDVDKILYFSHQMFHEYYCSWHICNSLSDEDFQTFLQETRRDERFIVVKKFLFGLVFDICRNQVTQKKKRKILIKFVISGFECPESSAYLKECNNQDAYNELIRNIPMRMLLCVTSLSEAHSLAHVLKGINKPIERVDIVGDENALPVSTAISHMPGCVEVLTIFPNHLCVLPYDVMDRLVVKVKTRFEVDSKFPINNEIVYNEKLAYLRELASSPGRPVVSDLSEFLD